MWVLGPYLCIARLQAQALQALLQAQPERARPRERPAAAKRLRIARRVLARAPPDPRAAAARHARVPRLLVQLRARQPLCLG